MYHWLCARDFWVCDACNLAKWIQTPLLCALQQILFLFSCSQKREATTKGKKKREKEIHISFLTLVPRLGAFLYIAKTMLLPYSHQGLHVLASI